MNEAWFTQIEPYVFTVLKKRMRGKFPNVFYTTSNEEVDERKFPCVYLTELEQIERGNDLVNKTVNAVTSTMQIQVFSKTAAENKEVMTEAALQMKQLAFGITSMPIYTSEKDKTVFFSVARFRRIVGANDKDIVPQ